MTSSWFFLSTWITMHGQPHIRFLTRCKQEQTAVVLPDTIYSEKQTMTYSYLPLHARPGNLRMLHSYFNLLIAVAPRSMAAPIEVCKYGTGKQCLHTNKQSLAQNYQVRLNAIFISNVTQLWHTWYSKCWLQALLYHRMWSHTFRNASTNVFGQTQYINVMLV